MSDVAALDRLMSLGAELHTPAGEPRRKFDLAHMRALLAALGNPEQRFSSILIAGTNGKGSTAATLASILHGAGFTTGLYTSPHLTRVNERIQVSGRELDDGILFQHLARVELAYTGLVGDGILPGPPSFFETMTAIAMLAFAQSPGTGLPVDLAVLEVGMGGRLDATNVVEPLFSIITDISLDHTEWLGPTIADIAREKAGILRRNGTLITLPQHPEANQAIGEVAVALNVEGINAADYLPGREASAAGKNQYELTGCPEMGEQTGAGTIWVDSPLRGQHQQRNLALAIAGAVELRNHHGYSLTNAQISEGIRATNWSGRLESLAATVHRPAVLLDAAHNPAGAWALRAALSQFEAAGPRVLIFGCMRDKALGEMAQILFPVFDHVYLTELPSPRTAGADELQAAAVQTGTSSSVYREPAAALKAAVEVAPDQAAALIVIAGSVLLVGALRSLLL